jgi:predicted amidophosphoribosyltransferase
MLLERHYHLNSDDRCGFLIEFTSHKGYEFSAANSLILNLKKKPSLRSTGPWRFKVQDIKRCSLRLGDAMNHNWLKRATLVPIPPSKVKTDPDYDDRIEAICKGIPTDFEIDVRNIVKQTESYTPSHESEDHRITVDELLKIYEIDEAVAAPVPTEIGIVDDVLTAGVHYRAMHTILSERFPDAKIYGFFIARRVLPDPADDFD